MHLKLPNYLEGLSAYFSVNRFFSSIRSKFVVLFVVFGLIPLIVVGTFSYKSSSNALLIQTREQLGNLADKTAQQIDTFFNGAEKDIRLLSNFPFIQLSFLQFEFGQRLKTAKRLLEKYSHNNQYFERIILINLEGRPILTVPENMANDPNDFHAQSWFKTATTTDLFLSDIIVSPSEKRSFVVLTKKIYDYENRSKPVGILVFEIKVSAFAYFVSSFKIGSQGYSFLLDQNGKIIYHPDKSLNEKNTLLEHGDAKLSGLVSRMLAGERGYGECMFKGQKKYMVFTSCSIKNWGVGITLQRSEFMAGIIKLRQQLMTFTALIIALITLASLLFARSLTLPISQLISGARAIGSGDLDQTIQVTSSDELQGLAKEFNSMAAKLKKSMQQILELKTFSDDIFRSVSSGIITVNRDGEVTSINKSAENILSFSLDRRIDNPPGVQQALALLTETLKKEKKIEHHVLEYSDHQSDPVFIEVNTSLLNDYSGDIIGAIADIRNITLRKQMEELMVRVDKLASLGELSAGIAHEIRNPLAGMKTSIQVLAKKITGESEHILIDGVLSEIDRLNEIVTDLLKFSGPSPSFPGPVDIRSVLTKTLDLLKEKIKKSGVTIEKRYEKPIGDTYLDREQIQQVFLNLMLNAINAMPHGGKLIISMKNINDHDRLREKITRSFDPVSPTGKNFMEVSITDTGPGIKKENLQRVFNPFFTTDPNGTGLGLPITHKLLEKNNAYIHISSKAKKGCHVSLILPLADEELT